MPDAQPNPGSDAAISLGCLCPVLDNHHGEGIPWNPFPWNENARSWWVSGDCPLHAPRHEPSGLDVS